MLLQPDTDLSILHRIRKQGKILLAQARSPIEQDAATALYYAAIASGLVFHRATISKLSNEQLSQALSTLSQETWLPSDLFKLFKKARLYCQTLEWKTSESTFCCKVFILFSGALIPLEVLSLMLPAPRPNVTNEFFGALFYSTSYAKFEHGGDEKELDKLPHSM